MSVFFSAEQFWLHWHLTNICLGLSQFFHPRFPLNRRTKTWMNGGWVVGMGRVQCHSLIKKYLGRPHLYPSALLPPSTPHFNPYTTCSVVIQSRQSSLKLSLYNINSLIYLEWLWSSKNRSAVEAHKLRWSEELRLD